MEHPKFPIKNIDPVLVDIKKPGFNYKHISKFSGLDLKGVPKPKNKHTHIQRLAWTFLLVCGLVLLGGGTYIGIKIISAKHTLAGSATEVGKNFETTLTYLSNGDTEEARDVLLKNKEEIEEMRILMEKNYIDGALKVAEPISAVTKDVREMVGNVASFNDRTLALTETLIQLKQNGFVSFRSDGRDFLRLLSDLKTNIELLNNDAKEIKNSISSIKKVFPELEGIDKTIGEKYVTYGSSLFQAEQFLSSLMEFIGQKDERYILVLFQNPAEMRPSGGFLGSFAEVSVKEGQLYQIQTQDIYDYDGQFFEKVIPPEALQNLTKNWGTRDANWFFDFPATAKTVSGFLEQSKINQEKGRTYDAVVAVNVNVLKTIMEIIGPVEMPEYKLTLTSDNILENLQREIEAGKDNKAGKPKQILKKLTPIIMERLDAVGKENQSVLAEKFADHVFAKDVMAYAKDTNLESGIEKVGISGSVYGLPQDFWGTYLAVVNANIAGGKSDAFIRQEIKATIDIDVSGNIFSDILIQKTHSGGKEKDPWWNKTNINYTQVYTTPNSNLVLVTGNTDHEKTTKFDYMNDGYVENEILKSIEDTKRFLPDFNTWRMQAFGKTVFATWWEVPAGNTKELDVRYHTPASKLNAVVPGKVYTFVFDKQSGVNTGLSVSITAPLKYTWKESGNSVFTYTNPNPEKRIVFTLTLEK